MNEEYNCQMLRYMSGILDNKHTILKNVIDRRPHMTILNDILKMLSLINTRLFENTILYQENILLR